MVSPAITIHTASERTKGWQKYAEALPKVHVNNTSQSFPCLSSALARRRREVLSSQDNISATCDLNYKEVCCAPCPMAKLVSIRRGLQLALSLLITKGSLFLQEGGSAPVPAAPPPCQLPNGFFSKSPLFCSLSRLLEGLCWWTTFPEL